MRRLLLSLLLAPAIVAAQAPAPAPAPAPNPAPPRAIRTTDLYRLKTVADPQRSPDGRWVAYTVTSLDSAKDKSDADLWMTSWDGAETVRLTWSPESESAPRWSPDRRYLAFVSGRQEGKEGQLWLLDRRGGEAQRVTQVKGGVSGYAWSPDGRRIVIGLEEETDSLARRDTGEKKTPKPIVLDRYGFKRDMAGYLGTARTHLAIFDLATRTVDTLTRGLADDGSPAWSPDGRRIAFVRRTPAEPKAADRGDVYVIEARGGATPVRLTDYEGGDAGPLAWSPDGRTIAFLRGDLPKYSAYTQPRLGVVASDGGAAARLLAEWVDRPLGAPAFTADGRIALLASTPDRAPEIFALERGGLRQLSHQNDSLFATLQLSMYGADQYISQYEYELGHPWEQRDLWIRLSRPFFEANRIRTPTMFMVGEKDFNVPAIGSEQMYQALRALGVPTKLVIYPNQYHGITVPSYRVDRYERWLGWYNQHLPK
ncbi:MAG: prolyl oligopeptidase family serine peptidase [Gemmatimonadaceae bacterium]